MLSKQANYLHGTEINKIESTVHKSPEDNTWKQTITKKFVTRSECKSDKSHSAAPMQKNNNEKLHH